MVLKLPRGEVHCFVGRGVESLVHTFTLHKHTSLISILFNISRCAIHAIIFNVYDLMMQDVVISADRATHVLLSKHLLMRLVALRRAITLDDVE